MQTAVEVKERMLAWESLTQKSTNRLSTEKQKLCMLRGFEEQLNKAILAKNPPIKSEDKTSTSPFKNGLKYAFYYFLLSFGLLEDSAGSYLFASSLFALIPGISNVMLIVSAAVYVVLDCMFFYAFEAGVLREALGISEMKTDLHELLETYFEQLKTAKVINELLSSLRSLTMDNAQYADYLRFAALMNEDFRKKNEVLGAYQESLAKKILKIGIIAFGALSSIAGSYFMATTFLALWAAPLLATPIGWGIILLTMTAGLGFYYAMGVRGMAKLVNPDYEKFTEYKKEMSQFQEKVHDSFEHIKSIRHRFEKKETREIGVQTGFPFFSPIKEASNDLKLGEEVSSCARI